MQIIQQPWVFGKAGIEIFQQVYHAYIVAYGEFMRGLADIDDLNTTTREFMAALATYYHYSSIYFDDWFEKNKAEINKGEIQVKLTDYHALPTESASPLKLKAMSKILNDFQRSEGHLRNSDAVKEYSGDEEAIEDNL